MKNVEIVPAVLPHDYQELSESLSFLRGSSNWVQVDLVDGEFIIGAARTWPFSESSHLSEILAGDEGLPYWQDFQYEFDLMVARPEEVVEDFVNMGASRIVIHVSSTDAFDEILDLLERTHTEAVAALSRSDEVSLLDPFAKRLKAVQVMGIAEIGVQGQPFDEHALDQIRAVKERYPDLLVQVDGGVSEETIAQLAHAGTERFISGSAILESEDAREKVADLERQARAQE